MDTNHYSFLAIGKTQESTEGGEGFKKYIGIGSSYVVAVCPTKEELTNIFGSEAKEPEYVVTGENGKEARITFIVKTDPNANNGIEALNRLVFNLRNTPAYNKDQTKVQVIDQFGNTAWGDVTAVKSNAKLVSADGNGFRIDTKYRMACVGEADLVAFLKAYLCVNNVFEYKNNVWIKREHPEEYVFALEHIKDYFNGDFSELKNAIALQPNNKVKLLYGIRTAETENGTHQYQAIANKDGLILRNSAGASAYARLEQTLQSAKEAGSYSNIEFKVQELQEWTVQPTNLDSAADSDFSNADSLWD